MRIALFLPALLLSAPAMAHRWVEMGAAGGTNAYIDANTMRRSGEVIEAWGLIDEVATSDAQPGGAQEVRARHFVTRTRYDCSARTFEVLSMVAYSSTDQGIFLDRRDVYEAGERLPVPPGTAEELSLDFACGYMRAEARALQFAEAHTRQPSAGLAMIGPEGGFFAAMEQQRVMRELPLVDGEAKVAAVVGRAATGGRPARVFDASDALEATATISPELPGPATITAHWFAANGNSEISIGRIDRLLDQTPFTETFVLRPTPAWEPGAYRLEVRVNGATAATVPFEVRSAKR